MKIVCSRKELVNKINIAKTCVPSKTTMSILQYIYIEAQDGMIRFFANDMENGVETILNGDVLEEGCIAVEASRFSNIASKIDGEEVTLITDEDYVLTIQFEKTKQKIAGRSGEDFTFPPVIEQIDEITLHQSTLKKFIMQTRFCVSTNDANKIMTGALFEIKDDSFSICALDGHRIAIRKTFFSSEYPDKKAIIHGNTLRKIESLLSDEPEKEVNIFITNHYACFVIEDTTFIAHLLEGTFFDVYQMMSGDYETKINIDRKRFILKIEQAMSVSSETDKRPIILDIEDHNMNLKINGNGSSMEGNLDITKQGKDIKIGFNPKFLTDALRVIEDEIIDIYFINPKAPCFIRNADSSYIYMILPINFKSVD